MVPIRRPELSGIRATLWKLWFDQWYSLRAVAGPEDLLFHGMDGFLPYALRSRDRCVVTVHDLGWQVHPELYDRRLRMMYGALFPWAPAPRQPLHRGLAIHRRRPDAPSERSGVEDRRGLSRARSRVCPAQELPAAPDQDAPYVLAVGGVSPRKNTRRLIAAFTPLA